MNITALYLVAYSVVNMGMTRSGDGRMTTANVLFTGAAPSSVKSVTNGL